MNTCGPETTQSLAPDRLGWPSYVHVGAQEPLIRLGTDSTGRR